MIAWWKITGRHYLGVWPFGLVLLALLEAPYMVMPLLHLESNPVMDVAESNPALAALEAVLGVSCVLMMLFVVQEGARAAGRVIAFVLLAANYAGWGLYFNGRQSGLIIMTLLVAMPPLIYAAIGWWRRNPVLVLTALAFLLVHLVHTWGNLHP